jgi:DNA-binding SARP family transcriptional activator
VIARIEQLDDLLQDAIVVAEVSQHEVLRHLIEARSVLRSNGRQQRPLRVEVVSARVFAHGVPVAVPRSELALILALAIRRRDLNREALIEDLYPNLDDHRAYNTLKVTVHRVRRRLGTDEAIRYESRTLSLGDNVDVDLPRLEQEMTRVRLEVELCREQRDYLERVRRRIVNGRPSFCLEWPWFEETERRLNDVARDIAALLASDALRNGHHQRAIDLALELARDDPSDEIAAEIAIRAFLLAGNRTAATLEYRRYSSELQRDGGQRPSHEINALILRS